MSKQEIFQDLSIEYDVHLDNEIELLSIQTLSGRDITESVSDEHLAELLTEIQDYEQSTKD
jgi:hypothetical protein